MKHTYITAIDNGERVACDACGCEFPASDTRSGGLLFTSHAYGPCCAERMERSIERYGETQFIRGRCPADKSFRQWVLEDLRQGNNTTTITTRETK